MRREWFAGCTTPQEIKTRYRALAMQYHPDRGGDTATMQDINAAYEAALKRADGHQTTDRTTGETHTYHYNEKTEREAMQKVQDLIRAGLPNCEIWIIGTWVWVMGETKPARETLKANGLRWNPNREAWYWRPAEWHGRYNKRADLDDLAQQYGCERFASSRR